MTLTELMATLRVFKEPRRLARGALAGVVIGLGTGLIASGIFFATLALIPRSAISMLISMAVGISIALVVADKYSDRLIGHLSTDKPAVEAAGLIILPILLVAGYVALKFYVATIDWCDIIYTNLGTLTESGDFTPEAWNRSKCVTENGWPPVEATA